MSKRYSRTLSIGGGFPFQAVSVELTDSGLSMSVTIEGAAAPITPAEVQTATWAFFGSLNPRHLPVDAQNLIDLAGFVQGDVLTSSDVAGIMRAFDIDLSSDCDDLDPNAVSGPALLFRPPSPENESDADSTIQVIYPLAPGIEDFEHVSIQEGDIFVTPQWGASQAMSAQIKAAYGSVENLLQAIKNDPSVRERTVGLYEFTNGGQLGIEVKDLTSPRSEDALEKSNAFYVIGKEAFESLSTPMPLKVETDPAGGKTATWNGPGGPLKWDTTATYASIGRLRRWLPDEADLPALPALSADEVDDNVLAYIKDALPELKDSLAGNYRFFNVVNYVFDADCDEMIYEGSAADEFVYDPVYDSEMTTTPLAHMVPHDAIPDEVNPLIAPRLFGWADSKSYERVLLHNAPSERLIDNALDVLVPLIETLRDRSESLYDNPETREKGSALWVQVVRLARLQANLFDYQDKIEAAGGLNDQTVAGLASIYAPKEILDQIKEICSLAAYHNVPTAVFIAELEEKYVDSNGQSPFELVASEHLPSQPESSTSSLSI